MRPPTASERKNWQKIRPPLSENAENATTAPMTQFLFVAQPSTAHGIPRFLLVMTQERPRPVYIHEPLHCGEPRNHIVTASVVGKKYNFFDREA